MKQSTTKTLTHDMTTGGVLKTVLAFAVPLFIGHIFQQVYSIVDTMVAGYFIGDQAIAAIGATTSLYSLIVNTAVALNLGYGIVVTRCFGAHDEHQMKQSIAGMFMLNAAAALVLTILSLTFLRPLLRFMNTPESIFEPTCTYIGIILAGMTATLGYNMFAAIMRAVGNSRFPLYFLIVSCVLNILLDLLLVVVFPMGVAGTALATVIAQGVSAVLCGIFVFRSYRHILPSRTDFKVPASRLLDLLTTGAAMALMLCVVDLGSVIFQRANNMLGETIIASWTATRRVMSMFMQVLSSLASATSTFVGQNFGAGRMDRIRTAIRRVIVVMQGWSAFSIVMIFLFGAALVRFTTGTDNPEIIANAVMSMRIHFCLFPALGVLFCLRMSMQAMGQKVIPVLSSCIELLMKLISAAFLIPRLGFLGTSITEPITWTLMMLFLLICYLRQNRAPQSTSGKEEH